MEDQDNIEDLGHWQCDFPIPVGTYGFLYEITNTTNNRKYIGKKQMQSIRKLPPLKGKKRKRRKVIDTDWKTYTGSSDALNKDIELLGKDAFSFKIIKLCCSKSELAYYEAKIQFENDVLLTEDYYNGIINCRIGRISQKK